MASTALKELGSPGDLPVVIRSRALIRLMLLVERVAKSTATVLIQGETGSGKEMIARSNSSDVAPQPRSIDRGQLCRASRTPHRK